MQMLQSHEQPLISISLSNANSSSYINHNSRGGCCSEAAILQFPCANTPDTRLIVFPANKASLVFLLNFSQSPGPCRQTQALTHSPLAVCVCRWMRLHSCWHHRWRGGGVAPHSHHHHQHQVDKGNDKVPVSPSHSSDVCLPCCAADAALYEAPQINESFLPAAEN